MIQELQQKIFGVVSLLLLAAVAMVLTSNPYFSEKNSSVHQQAGYQSKITE